MRDVIENLLRLLLERRFVELAPVRRDRQLTRDEDEPAGEDRLALVSAGLGLGRGVDVNDLTSHRNVSIVARHPAR